MCRSYLAIPAVVYFVCVFVPNSHSRIRPTANVRPPNTAMAPTPIIIEPTDHILLVVPPDGGYGWVIMVASFLCNAIVDGTMYSFAIYIPDLTAALDATEMQITSIGSVYVSMYYLCGPLVSALINQCGFRTAAIGGTLLTAVGYASASFSHWYPAHVLLQGVLAGLGGGAAYAGAVIIVGYYFDKYRALATSVAVCGSGVGTMVLSRCLAMVLDRIGWEQTLRLQAGLVLIASALSVLYRPLQPTLVALHDGIALPVGGGGGSGAAGLGGGGGRDADADSTFMRSQIVGLDNVHVSSKNLQRNASYAMSTDTFSRYFREPTGGQRLSVSYRQRPRGKCMRWLRSPSRCCRDRHPHHRDSDILRTNVLDRQDLFYHGSLAQLPTAAAAAAASPLPAGPSQLDIVIASMKPQALADGGRPTTTASKCAGSSACCQVIGRLIDVSLFGSVTYIVMLASLFTYTLVMMIPYMFVVRRAQLNGVRPKDTEWLILYLALGNTVGRIVAGGSSFCSRVQPASLVGWSTIAAGLATLLSVFVIDSSKGGGAEWLWLHVSYALFIGFGMAFSQALRTVIYVQYMGLERLTAVFGLSTMVMGVAALIGTPLASALNERMGTLSGAFHFSGAMLITSGSIMLMLGSVNRWELNKRRGVV